MVDSNKELDKKRFEKLKETEIKHGRPEETANKVAAKEVKQLRTHEGRSKPK